MVVGREDGNMYIYMYMYIHIYIYIYIYIWRAYGLGLVGTMGICCIWIIFPHSIITTRKLRASWGQTHL